MADDSEKKKENEDKPDTAIVIIDESTIRNKIYEVRGVKVMLDFELAEIYGYSTTAFNQQVKNNIENLKEMTSAFILRRMNSET